MDWDISDVTLASRCLVMSLVTSRLVMTLVTSSLVMSLVTINLVSSKEFFKGKCYSCQWYHSTGRQGRAGQGRAGQG